MKIEFKWKERTPALVIDHLGIETLNPKFDEARVGAMYCFRRCDVNWN